jgi:hypothetical protein
VRKWIALASVLLVGLIGVAVAYAANTVTLEVKALPNKASTKKSIKPIRLAINIGIAETTGAQPSPLRKVVIRFNKGGTFNGKQFPKCKRSALEARGVRGCPKASIVGKGTAQASAKPIIDLVNAEVTILNGEPKGGVPTVLLYNVPDISSPIIVQGTVAKKSASACGDGGQCDYTLTFDVPDIPTLPNAPPASVLSVRTTTSNVFVRKRKRVRGRTRTVKIPYIGAPKECRGGKWHAESEVTFANGEKIKTPTSSSCRR